MADRESRSAPRLVTTRFDTFSLFAPWLGLLVAAVPYGLLKSGVGVALSLLVVLAVAAGWWLWIGRFWHPVKEARWERAEWRLGHRQWSQDDGYVTFRKAWEQAGGDPPEALHLPASDSPATAKRG